MAAGEYKLAFGSPSEAEFEQLLYLYAFLLYACLFSREGTVPERSAMAQQISAVPVRTLMDEIAASAEFAALLQ